MNSSLSRLGFSTSTRRAIRALAWTLPVLALAFTGTAQAASNVYWDPAQTTYGSDNGGTITLSSLSFGTGNPTTNPKTTGVDITAPDSAPYNLVFGVGSSTPYTVTLDLGRILLNPNTVTFAGNYTLAGNSTGEGVNVGNINVNAGFTVAIQTQVISGGSLTLNGSSIANLSGGGSTFGTTNSNGNTVATAGTLNYTAGVWDLGNNTTFGNNANFLDLNISGGVYVGGSTGIHWGEGGGTLVATQTAGDVDAGLLLGQGNSTSGGSSTLNIQGGEENVNNNFSVGSTNTAGAGGNAVLNVSGGSVVSSQNGYIGGTNNGAIVLTDTMNIDGGYVSFEGKTLYFGDTTAATYAAGSTATLNLSSGTLYVGGLITSTGSTNLTQTFNYSGGLLGASASSTWTMPIVITASGGTFQMAGPDGQSYSVTDTGAISGSGSLTKTGIGTLTLGATETYTGSTTVDGGTLVLDFSNTASPAANILASGGTPATSTALTLAGSSTFSVKGKSASVNSQELGNVTVSPGANTMSITSNSATSVLVSMGTLTQNAGGTVDFIEPSGTVSATNGFTTTSVNDASGILGAWAVVGTGSGTEYATNNGTDIVAYTAGTTAASNLAGITSTGNYNLGANAYTLAATGAANTFRDTSAGTIDLSSNTLSLNGFMNAVGGGGLITISDGTLAIGSSNQLVISGSGAVTISADITDGTAASALVDSDIGQTLILSGNNTYTGGTFLNTGIVQVAASDNPGVSGALGASGAITFSGGELQYASSGVNTTDYSGRILNSLGAIKIDPNSNFITFASALDASNTGGLTVTTSSSLGGELILSEANAYTGLTSIIGSSATTEPTLQLSGAGTLGATSNALYLSDGILDLNGTNQSVSSLYSANNSNIIMDSSATPGSLTVGLGDPGTAENFYGSLEGGWNLVKDGGGTSLVLYLSNANLYTGAVTINGGTLGYFNAGTFSAAGSGTITVNDGGILLLYANAANTTGTLPTLYLAGQGTGNDGGAIQLNGVNTIGNNIVLQDNTGFYTATTAGTYTGTITANNYGIILAGNQSSVTTFSGNITLGSGGITKGPTESNATVDIFSGNNSYTGDTILGTGGGGSGTGTLRAGSTTAFGGGMSELDIVSPAVAAGYNQDLDLAGYNNAFGSITGGTTSNGGSITLGDATITTGNDNSNTTYSGSIENISPGKGNTDLIGGGVTKNGTGTQTFLGANTYAVTTISGGTLATSAGVGTTATTTGFSAGATSITVSSIAGLVTGQVLTGTGLAPNTIISGISGTTVYLTIPTTGTGAGGETITASAWQSLGQGALNLANVAGTTLDISAGAVAAQPFVGSINGGGSTGGNIVLGANTLTTGTDGTTATYGGSISGTGGIIMSGTGTQTFSGASTYSGATTVSSGTLLIANTTGSATGTSAVTVNNGGTFGGGAGAGNDTLVSAPGGAISAYYKPGVAGIMTGTGSSLTINSGGTLAPGNGGVGTLTVAALTLNAGSVETYEFNGTANDFTSATAFTLTGSSTFNFLVEGTTTAFDVNGVYDLIGYTSFTGDVANLAASSLDSATGASYSFRDDATDDVIQVTITGGITAPEPSTWALMLGGVALLLGVSQWRRIGRRMV